MGVKSLILQIFSAVLCVSLRPLRLSCRLTQRTLRYAEDAEKIDQFKTLPGPVNSIVDGNNEVYDEISSQLLAF